MHHFVPSSARAGHSEAHECRIRARAAGGAAECLQ